MTAAASPAPTLTLEEATTIASAALTYARQQDFEPVSVAVLDAAGTIKCLQTEDRIALLRPDVAIAKAWGCLGLGRSTQSITRMSQEMGSLFHTFRDLSDGRLVPSPGGVLIVRQDELVGAVGVSGDTGPNDERCALAGIEASGLIAQL